MTKLVLTIVGDDRAGLVAAVADVVGAHGGNWENSQMAELAGAFAGIVEVSVTSSRVEALREALSALKGLHTVAVRAHENETTDASTSRQIKFEVLGNDHPGIVLEISSTLSEHGLSIDRMTTEIRDAAMSGGRLFEAAITASVPASVDVDEVKAELERLAAEIHVDVILTS